MPTAEWDGNRRVKVEGRTFLDAYRALMCMFWIAESKLTP